MLKTLPASQTSYEDFQVNPGQTYFYVVTEVDNTSAESANSSESSATVQSP